MAKIKDYLWRYKIILLIFIFLPIFVFAHCPLCTAGAGIGAIIAKELGTKSSAIGVWIGGFSVALGWWLSNILQVGSLDAPVWPPLRFGSNIRPRPTRISLANLAKFLIILISFLSVVLPLRLYFYETGSFYLYLFGDYGSLFNRTYVYDKFLLGSILGGLVILISPLLNKKLSQLRQGRTFPYQRLVITFLLLILLSILFQILV
ncbi:MAG: hypothetical protein QXN68_05450 [Thermoplasmata archaeon]